MSRYLVDVKLSYVVSIEVEARDEDEAKRKAIRLAIEEQQSAPKYLIDPEATDISKSIN